MFSALKKLTSPRPETPVSPLSPQGGGQNVHSMASNLQRKFAKGCNYNMKLVIRGDCNTGKSCLLARLQGQPFNEQYNPTQEIQVASINWSYKNTEDIVKVEVWDVVDVAKKRVKIAGLKVQQQDRTEQADAAEFCPGLDAEFLDVYQGTHGVIFLLDVTKPWTLEYVRRETEKVPSSLPILILANFTDQSHHRQVTQMEIADFVENFSRRGDDSAEVRWAELSLRNGFGLKLLHRWFNVPFLALQRQSLLQQIEINNRDIQANREELDLYMSSPEACYSQFSEGLTNKRRAEAEQRAPLPSASIVAGQPSNCVDPLKSSSLAPAQATLTFSSAKPRSPSPAPSPSPVPPESHISAPAASPLTVKSHSGGAIGAQNPSKQTRSPASTGGKVDVDSFVPDAGDFDNFLNEADVVKSSVISTDNIDSSSDDESGNPMVARFDDSVDVDSYAAPQRLGNNLNEDTSDEEDIIINESQPVKKTTIEEQDAISEDNGDLEDFLGSDNLDKTVESFCSTYETL